MNLTGDQVEEETASRRTAGQDFLLPGGSVDFLPAQKVLQQCRQPEPFLDPCTDSLPC